MIVNLIEVALLALVFVPLERVHMARRQKVLRPEWWIDGLFLAGQLLLWTQLAVAGLQLAYGVLAPWSLPGLVSLRGALRGQPFWLQAVEVVLLGDFFVYWAHRLSHRIPLLWRFHRVHHSAEHLDWIAGFREHPLDGMWTMWWVNLPAMLLGFPLDAIAGVVAFRGLWGVFIHSNAQLPLGPLRYVLGSPRLHHWHHDIDRGGQCNFANLMPLMDLLFGTYYLPDERPAAYGLREAGPRGYIGQLLAPLGLWPITQRT